MKNIHILPTNKPSKLHLWTDDKGSKLELCDLEYSHTRNTQNIYITNDDEEDKKIILTTDQDLIKNGVQSIDDEFLEWFIKNPSCERVEVKAKWFTYMEYKIIIPKEFEK